MSMLEFLEENLFQDTEYEIILKDGATMAPDGLIKIRDIAEIRENGKVIFESRWWNAKGQKAAKFCGYQYHERVSHGYWARNAHNRLYWSGMVDSPAKMILRLRTLEGEELEVDIIDTIKWKALCGGNFTQKRLSIIEDVIYDHDDWAVDDDGKPLLDEVIAEIKRRCRI